MSEENAEAQIAEAAAPVDDAATAEAIAEETNVPAETVEEETFSTPAAELSEDEKVEQEGEFVDPDYASLAQETGEMEGWLDAPVTAEEPAEEQKAEAEETPPPEPEVVAEEKTPEPAAAPETPPESPEPTAPETPTAEEMREQYETRMKEIREALLGQYKLSEEEAATLDELDAKPSEYLPKYLAQVHENVYLSLLQSMTQVVPGVTNQVIEQNKAAQAAEDAFFSRWEPLKDVDREGRETIGRAIAAVQQANPNLDMAQTIEQAGALAMIQLGKTLVPEETPEGGDEIPEEVRTPPPKPAMPGGAGVITPPKPTHEESVYLEMAEEELRQ